MKIRLFFCLFYLTSQFLFSQNKSTVLTSDSALYEFALKSFINEFESKDSIWLEGNSAYDCLLPKSINQVKIKWIYPIDYVEYVKMKKNNKVIKMTPIKLDNGCFEISISSFNISYEKKRRLLTFVNCGGIRLKFSFDCLNLGYVLITESLGH